MLPPRYHDADASAPMPLLLLRLRHAAAAYTPPHFRLLLLCYVFFDVSIFADAAAAMLRYAAY